MLSHHITLGYNPGVPTKDRNASESDLLLECLEKICADVGALVDEAKKCGTPEIDCKGQCRLLDYAAAYADASNRILTIKQSDEQLEIIQWAAASCPVKLGIRRAFIRRLMFAAHSEGIDINVIAA